MMQDYFDWDAHLFLFFNNLGNSHWDWFWLIITEKKTWIPLYVFLLVFFYLKLGWKKTLIACICITLMIISTDQLTNLVKNYFQRLRPCYTPDIQGLFRPIDCEGRGRYGFTSAHASNHIALAIFIGYIIREKYKWVMYILILWALLIAYSRVYVGVHFTGDIFFGSLIGVIFSYLYIKFYYYLENKFKNNRNL